MSVTLSRGGGGYSQIPECKTGGGFKAHNSSNSSPKVDCNLYHTIFQAPGLRSESVYIHSKARAGDKSLQ